MDFLKKLFAQIKENFRITSPGNRIIRRDMTLELTEINEITEKLVQRIDNKIKILKTVEAQADQKIVILDGLISKLKNMPLHDRVIETAERGHQNKIPSLAEKGHQEEIQSLAHKGFNSEQIARILDLPSGEVELILNLTR